MPTPLRYASGEVIAVGDVVRYMGGPGVVELVVTERTGREADDWHLIDNPAGGCMIVCPAFGRVFLPAETIDEELEFASRAQAKGDLPRGRDA